MRSFQGRLLRAGSAWTQRDDSPFPSCRTWSGISVFGQKEQERRSRIRTLRDDRAGGVAGWQGGARDDGYYWFSCFHLVFQSAIGWCLILSTIWLSSNSSSGLYSRFLNLSMNSLSLAVKTSRFERNFSVSLSILSRSIFSVLWRTGSSSVRISYSVILLSIAKSRFSGMPLPIEK